MCWLPAARPAKPYQKLTVFITLSQADTPRETDTCIRTDLFLMTAKAVTITLSGKRNIGDTGNDYIAGKQFSNGHDAEGYFEWEFPDGTTVSWDAAVFDVKNCGGGDSTSVAALEFDAISNGKPTVTPAV